jgi:tripartite ATP-independent transporter DctP family solute receptor
MNISKKVLGSILLPAFVILAGLVLVTGCGGGASAPGTAKKTIKLSHSHPDSESSEIHTAALAFKEHVEKNSDKLEVKIYASSALGQEREVYEGMQLGSGASCTITGTAILNNFTEKIGVLDLPFLWKDYEHVHKALDGQVGQMLAQDLDKAGLKVLAWMDSWGYRHVVTANKEVTKPEDLQGLKIRTIQTPIYVSTINMMGMNATPMAFSEVYTSMQTGVIDGFEHGAAVVMAKKFYEVADYIALTKHLFGPLVFCYSKQEWGAMSDENKQLLMEAAKVARDKQRALAPVKEKEALNFLKEKGMTVHEIDTTQFQQKAKSLQEEIASERGAMELLELIRAAE